MEKLYARLFFVSMPALSAFFIGYLLHPIIGIVLGVCAFGLGWQVTAEPNTTPKEAGDGR